jgi:hypothetical protein
MYHGDMHPSMDKHSMKEYRIQQLLVKLKDSGQSLVFKLETVNRFSFNLSSI